ncbi:hypothetical protein Tco_0919258 [Tanacetum coccineum]
MNHHTLSKRNGIEEESSNDNISKDDSMNKEASSIEVNIGGNDETWEFEEKISLFDSEMPKANGSDENGGKTKSYANMVKSNEMLVNKGWQ